MSTQDHRQTRRHFIANGIRLSFAATALHALPARAALCVDPEELSSVDYSFRKYVEYTESYSDPIKTCSQCANFKPPANGGECGTCSVVAGSINKNGHCTGWEPRKENK